MADSDFGWVGPVMVTMVVGSMLMGMSNNMNRQFQRTRTTTTYSRTKRGTKKAVKTTGRIQGHPGNFGNILF